MNTQLTINNLKNYIGKNVTLIYTGYNGLKEVKGIIKGVDKETAIYEVDGKLVDKKLDRDELQMSNCTIGGVSYNRTYIFLDDRGNFYCEDDFNYIFVVE